MSEPDTSTAEEQRDPHDVAVDSNEQPFLEHIIELRSRILRSLAAIGILFIPFFVYSEELYEWIAHPLVTRLPEGSTMIATQVATPFFTPLKLAIFAAIFVGVPFWLHQMWAFVSPGLYRHEKRFAMPLLASSVFLFYSGMAFVYFLVFPLVFAFFTQTGPESMAMMTDIDAYLNFVLKMFFAFGLAFEVPIATMLIVWSGITTADNMAKKRPYIIVGCFVVGMLLTPPDVISQLLLAIPTWILFELGVFLARFIEQRETPAQS